MNFELAFAKFQFGLKQRASLYRKIASFARQGVPIYTAIERFVDEYSKKRGDPRVLIMQEWLLRMRDGNTFGQALQGYAPEAELMLIQAGEAQGDLSRGIEKAIFVTESVARIRSAVISGLAYPVTVFALLIVMIYLFAIKVVPQLTQILPPEKWPEGPPQILYGMSVLVRDYGLWITFALVFGVVLSIKTLGVFRGPLRKAFDYFPPWSIYKTLQSSVFLITVSSLMSAGISINAALLRIREIVPPYVADYIGLMIDRLAMGESNGSSVDVGFLPYDTAVDIRILGQTADFQSLLQMLGEETVENDVQRITAATRVLSIAILLLTGVYIGFTYYAFYVLTSEMSEILNSGV